MDKQDARFLLIAGPCSAESEEVCRAAAEVLVQLREKHPELQVVFKASFDKANRTSLNSPRGPGLEEGLQLFKQIKEQYELPVLTDIHLPEQCAPVSQVCDVLQIPAFLCRQTDLLVAAAQTGAMINVKKGQFLSPYEMQHVVNKLEECHARGIWLTERGTTFGYQNLVVDMRSFEILGNYGYPVVMDATHSVQLPGAAAGQSGGDRKFVPVLARAAVAAGANGLFVEAHPDPDRAVSDAASQLKLDDLPELTKSCLNIRRACGKVFDTGQ